MRGWPVRGWLAAAAQAPCRSGLGMCRVSPAGAASALQGAALAGVVRVADAADCASRVSQRAVQHAPSAKTGRCLARDGFVWPPSLPPPAPPCDASPAAAPLPPPPRPSPGVAPPRHGPTRPRRAPHLLADSQAHPGREGAQRPPRGRHGWRGGRPLARAAAPPHVSSLVPPRGSTWTAWTARQAPATVERLPPAQAMTQMAAQTLLPRMAMLSRYDRTRRRTRSRSPAGRRSRSSGSALPDRSHRRGAWRLGHSRSSRAARTPCTRRCTRGTLRTSTRYLVRQVPPSARRARMLGGGGGSSRRR